MNGFKICIAILLSAILALAGSGSLQAAEAPSAKAARYNWEGYYVGVTFGQAFADINWDNSNDECADCDLAPAYFDLNSSDSSLIGGLKLGYNFQKENYVWGFEASAQFSGVKDSTSAPLGWDNYLKMEKSFQLGVNAKLGYAFDRLLLYGTAGVAGSQFNFSTYDDSPCCEEYNLDTRNFGLGWNAGVGADYALTDKLIVGLEWKYFDFSSIAGAECEPCGGPGFDYINVSSREHVISLGVSYRF